MSANRCFGEGDPLYAAYHDTEWGRPVTTEAGLFERLSLEAFQSGLSWRTVLAKRPRFREAFRGFEPDAVARFGRAEVARLLGDAGIIRNRAKIDATIANARAVVGLREREEDLATVIWAHRPAAGSPAPRSFADVPAITPESRALAATLKGHGLRFVGPTTAYALMQAAGLVNDHLAACFVRDEVATEQERAGRAYLKR